VEGGEEDDVEEVVAEVVEVTVELEERTADM